MTTIKEGSYKVPEGYTAKCVNRVVHVYKTKRSNIPVGEYRCRDCKHYVRGYSCYWETIVCDMKPKRVTLDGKQLYYSAIKYGKPCKDFVLRESK